MKITAFNGSPAGRNSATHKMIQQILAGAEEEGAETENFFLAEKEIQYCKACGYCLDVELNKCIIEDDMQEMLNSFKRSDVVIYATPLYFDNVSGLMEVFFDRRLALVAPHIGKDEKGEFRHVDKAGFSNAFEKIPKLVAVSNAAFPEQSHFQVLSHLFERMARNIHTEVIAEIYRGSGPLLKQDIPALMPVIQGYEKLLREAGKEIVSSLGLSEKTKVELGKPLFPYDAYVKVWNGMIEKNWESRL